MPTLSDGFCTFQKWTRVISLVGCTATMSITNTSLWAGPSVLPDGQANLPHQFNTLNLDLSGRANADDLRSGVRVAFPRFSEHFVFFLDTQTTDSTRSGIALNNEVDVTGRTRGGGVYFTDLPAWRDYTMSVRVSGQSEELDVDSNIVVSGIQAQTVLKNRSVSVALILSPATATFANGANTYITLGASYQRQRRNINLNGQDQRALYRYEQNYVPQLALGIVYPFKRISLFASVEYEEDFALGLGLRLQLTKDHIK